MPAAVPISRKALKNADRGELANYYAHCRKMGHAWLKKQILEYNRIDILAVAVLGMKAQPFHVALMKFQFTHPDNLQLVFRGAGKTSTCTVVKTIHLLLKNPNLRILLASKTSQNAEGFLTEIKNHFENNVLLGEIFGKYHDPRRNVKWDSREIVVLPRTSPNKEASVTCVGVEGTIVSKHYDVIICDDLVDEENSRTQYMRDKTKTWYYQTLLPTLEPPDSDVEHRGELHRLGTRYHWADLYGHLMDNELKDHTQVIPALDEMGRSPWPEKYPAAWFAKRKRESGLIIFNAQYQCNADAMKGEIFQYDHCQEVGPEEWPATSSLRVYMGVDLAISQKDTADKFAIVVIGVLPEIRAHYILDYFEGQLRFKAQTAKIVEYYTKWDPIRCMIETNQYQEAQYQTLKDEYPDIRLKEAHQDKDKISRAMKLSAIFEDGKVFFRKGQQAGLIEHLVLFPAFRYKDLFDAFDLAIRASRSKRKRTRREPGVM